MGFHPFLSHHCAFCVTILDSDELTRLGCRAGRRFWFSSCPTRDSNWPILARSIWSPPTNGDCLLKNKKGQNLSAPPSTCTRQGYGDPYVARRDIGKNSSGETRNRLLSFSM